MLPKGLISSVHRYYMHSPRYRGDVMRAFRAFFEEPAGNKGNSPPEILPLYEGLFLDWFLYDFRLPNGKTPFADFLFSRHSSIPESQIELYRHVLETNTYGLFETLKSDVGKGLRIRNLQTGEEIDVEERKLTFQIQPGEIFFERIASVGGHNEFVGADTFRIARNDRCFQEFLKDRPGWKTAKLTPMSAYDLYRRMAA